MRNYSISNRESKYHDSKVNWVSKKEQDFLNKTNGIQNNIIKRLYYNEKSKFNQKSVDFKSGGFKLPCIKSTKISSEKPKFIQDDLKNAIKQTG